jgi:hypothetical protein
MILENEIRISAPPSKVWRILCEFDGYDRWHPSRRLNNHLCRDVRDEAEIQKISVGLIIRPHYCLPRLTLASVASFLKLGKHWYGARKSRATNPTP